MILKRCDKLRGLVLVECHINSLMIRRSRVQNIIPLRRRLFPCLFFRFPPGTFCNRFPLRIVVFVCFLCSDLRAFRISGIVKDMQAVVSVPLYRVIAVSMLHISLLRGDLLAREYDFARAVARDRLTFFAAADESFLLT